MNWIFSAAFAFGIGLAPLAVLAADGSAPSSGSCVKGKGFSFVEEISWWTETSDGSSVIKAELKDYFFSTLQGKATRMVAFDGTRWKANFEFTSDRGPSEVVVVSQDDGTHIALYVEYRVEDGQKLVEIADARNPLTCLVN